MPFYEYECESCKFYTELMQKISDPPLQKCPSCGKKTMKKLVSAPVFRLKGSGWYETDFKSDNENKRNLAGADKEESKKEDASSTKSEDKSDAKPAPAVEKKATESKRETASPGGRSGRAVAAKGKSKPAAGRAPSKAKAKAKAKGKARKGRR
jgi:putative FmdB family regulatory protein